MTTITQISSDKSEEENPVASTGGDDFGGRGGNGMRAFMRRPIALLSAVAVMGLTALGVLTLGTLYNGEPASVAASGVGGPAGPGGKIVGGANASANVSLDARTYRLDEGGELVSE
jgi:hypothetical protein